MGHLGNLGKRMETVQVVNYSTGNPMTTRCQVDEFMNSFGLMFFSDTRKSGCSVVALD